MNHQKTFVLLSLLAAVMTGAPASAQTMYRCGSAYQDHPCEGAQAGKVLKAQGGAGGGSTVSDAECSDRGARSLKIVWAREAGASAERQMQERGADPGLIADVYRRRGSAPDVRAAIEADCVAAKDPTARAAALIEALKGASGSPAAAPAPATAAAPAQPDPAAAEAQRQQQAAAREAEAKKKRCDTLKAHRESIISEQRAGGSAGRMENLNRSRQDADSALSNAGCR